MSKYDLWLKSIDQNNTSLYLLEKSNDWRLFQLKKSYWERHFKFYNTTYHIWNVMTGEWNTTTNHRDAMSLYKNRIATKEEI